MAEEMTQRESKSLFEALVRIALFWLYIVLVLSFAVIDGVERVGWFENRFSEMMGDERSFH